MTTEQILVRPATTQGWHFRMTLPGCGTLLDVGFLVDVLIAIFVGGPTLVIARRVMSRRIERTGNFEIALRVVEGSQTGLTSKWRHGTARVSPGALTFRPAGPGGMRIPTSAPFTVSVVGAAIDGERHPDKAEMWSINPALHLATIRTDSAVIDLAARAEALPALITELASS